MYTPAVGPAADRSTDTNTPTNSSPKSKCSSGKVPFAVRNDAASSKYRFASLGLFGPSGDPTRYAGIITPADATPHNPPSLVVPLPIRPLGLSEQADLAKAADSAGRGHSEMRPRLPGGDASAWSARDHAGADEERLTHLLDRGGFLPDRDGERRHSDGSATET